MEAKKVAYRIMIDPGHGGYDNGASYGGRKEKDDNLELAFELGKALEEEGFDVVYTRTTDVYQSPVEKAQIANRSGADLLISLHRNSSENPNTYNGVQTLIFSDGGVKREMADNINKEMEAVGFKNLGISVRPNLAVLRATRMPALLVESGFINSDVDNEIFANNVPEIAQAIADGVKETLETIVPNSGYAVQVGLYRNRNNAQYALNEVMSKGYSAQIVPWREYYSVQVGNFNSMEDAVETEQELSREGYETLIVKR